MGRMVTDLGGRISIELVMREHRHESLGEIPIGMHYWILHTV